MAKLSRISKEAQQDGYAWVNWIPIAERMPSAGQFVLVKMREGNIEAAQWNAERSDWSRAPFCDWGEPMAWAPLPVLGKKP